MSEHAEIRKVYGRALDPIHIGAGGYRLGRVDNTIVRDPATDVPKIPGTSIAGVVKAFSEVVEKEDKNKEDSQKQLKEIDIKEAFGTEERKGALRFYDGQIIFFPVPSVQGTVWITTKELLEYWFGEKNDEDEEAIKIPEDVKDEAYALKGIDKSSLNLGWLLLEVRDVVGDEKKEISLPSTVNKWVSRIVCVSDKLFSHIVNDNLEVRTSVKIDPKTGTAEAGKLFTYEAIPRGTVFGFEVGVEKHRFKNADVSRIIEAVSPYFQYLGIGGMGTRGFGRLELAIEQKRDKGSETDAQP